MQNNISPTDSEMKVYAGLIMSPYGPQTQSQVAKEIGMSKSNVGKCVKTLLRSGYIRKIGSSQRNMIYKRGKNYALIEYRIKANRSFNRLIDDLAVADSRDDRVVRVHLNGGWISIPVIQEGSIDSFEYRPSGNDGCRLRQILFGDEPSRTDMRGLETRSGSLSTNDGLYRLQYMVGIRTGSMTLKIQPPGMMRLASKVISEIKAEIDPFYVGVAKVLTFLEKYGGWKFKKNEDGTYAVRNKCRIEYGMDAEISEAVRDIMGDDDFKIGDALWMDRSLGSMSREGELETDRVDMVEAIHLIPVTTGRCLRLNREFNEFRTQVENRFRKLENGHDSSRDA